MEQYYAHSTESADKSEWQTLSEHLLGVAKKAGSFAADFSAREWGYRAGLLHDAGKASGAFQRRLEGSTERVDHSTFGARLAKDKSGPLGLLLAYALAGHHGGLPDGGDQETQLHFRLKYGNVPKDVKLVPTVDCHGNLTLPFKLSQDRGGFSLSFFARMIFSCLVDADFLDTEEFCSPHRAKDRFEHFARNENFIILQKKLNAYLEAIVREAESTPVNTLRQNILSQCRKKAKFPQQIFSLTVPTGGGKTLSSMAFALDHSIEHELRRVIYAIPFTSIIEQNAQIFKKILGYEQVLEHHSNYKEQEEPMEVAYNRRRGLAAENWDVPVVVTTNVQFFESLFSHKTSRCRKLHNISRSVIVLDEAQAIPTEYLEPCLAVLRELVEHYGCSVVLCTATQPAFDDKNTLRMALSEICEIIDDPAECYAELQRTEVIFIGRKTDVEIVELLGKEKQVLCIVSTKSQARTIFELLSKEEGVFHLSTNMYPQHRRRVLDNIRQRLKKKEICRVVSTSLVEAGVDLDFPVLYRAMAGLDSIAQAAGRCNRDGKLTGLGKVFIFETEETPSMPWLKRCISRAKESLRSLPGSDPLGIEMMRRYFELLYDVQELDKKQIVRLLTPTPLRKELFFPFKDVGQSFRFIEEETIGVIVAIEPEAKRFVQELRYTEFPNAVLRKLQQYSIEVRMKAFVFLNAAGALEMIHEKIPILCNEAAYSKDVGLCIDEGEVWNVEDLIK